MEQYIVRTPKNPEYTGKAVGVQFRMGEGFVNEYTIDKRLKLTVREVIQRFGELGYEVTEILGESQPYQFTDSAPVVTTAKVKAEKSAPAVDPADDSGSWAGLVDAGKVAEGVTRVKAATETETKTKKETRKRAAK